MSCNCSNTNTKCNCSNSSSGSSTNPFFPCTTVPSNACCQGLSLPKFNVAKAKTICGYIDRIYDNQIGQGSALFDIITTDTIAYGITTVLTNKNPSCCTPCTLGSGAVFIPNDCRVSTLLTLTTTIPFTNNQVFINGVTIPELILNPDGSYTAYLGTNNGVPAQDCANVGLGTKSTVMIKDVGPWSYTATSDIYGTMNYNGQSCAFKITLTNVTPQIADTESTTFMVQNICIPTVQSTINFNITGTISIVNPIITYDAVNQIVNISASAVIVPQLNMEVLQKTKVCLQAML